MEATTIMRMRPLRSRTITWQLQSTLLNSLSPTVLQCNPESVSKTSTAWFGPWIRRQWGTNESWKRFQHRSRIYRAQSTGLSISWVYSLELVMKMRFRWLWMLSDGFRMSRSRWAWTWLDLEQQEAQFWQLDSEFRQQSSKRWLSSTILKRKRNLMLRYMLYFIIYPTFGWLSSCAIFVLDL